MVNFLCVNIMQNFIRITNFKYIYFALDNILEVADNQEVALLVVGDPFG